MKEVFFLYSQRGAKTFGMTGIKKRAAMILVLVLPVVLLSCSHGGGPTVETVKDRIDRGLLKGAWASGRAAYDFLIDDDSIQYEYDTGKRPYRLKNDVIIVDHGPDLGTRKSRIIELTSDTLILQDIETENTEMFKRRE